MSYDYESNPVQVYAKWVNVHGAQAIAEQAVMSRRPATVTIRYREDVTPQTRIMKGGKLYEMSTAPDDIQERHEYMELQILLVEGSS